MNDYRSRLLNDLDLAARTLTTFPSQEPTQQDVEEALAELRELAADAEQLPGYKMDHQNMEDRINDLDYKVMDLRSRLASETLRADGAESRVESLKQRIRELEQRIELPS